MFYASKRRLDCLAKSIWSPNQARTTLQKGTEQYIAAALLCNIVINGKGIVSFVSPKPFFLQPPETKATNVLSFPVIHILYFAPVFQNSLSFSTVFKLLFISNSMRLPSISLCAAYLFCRHCEISDQGQMGLFP